MASPDLPKVALIAGPTASGKSALALALAERTGGTIINADSAQVYAELRVLTARPSIEEEARASHRLFGHISGTQDYSAARWADEAKAEIAAAHARGSLPILVGGTGMYIRTLFEGIAPVPPIDPAIRAEVREASAGGPPEAIHHNHRRLASLDPEAAARLHLNDRARVDRALEVVLSTGRTLADWQAQSIGGIAGSVHLAAWLMLPGRGWLSSRCDERLAWMFANGAVHEVRELLAMDDIAPEAPIRRAIGVADIAAAIEGRITPAEAEERTALATRQYMKRQYTWFTRQPPEHWHREVYDFDTNRNIAEIELLLQN